MQIILGLSQWTTLGIEILAGIIVLFTLWASARKFVSDIVTKDELSKMMSEYITKQPHLCAESMRNIFVDRQTYETRQRDIAAMLEDIRETNSTQITLLTDLKIEVAVIRQKIKDGFAETISRDKHIT